MNSNSWPRSRVLAISGSVFVLVVAIVIIGVATGGSAKKTANPAASSLVIGPAYAKTLGFAVTVQGVKESSVTESGCTDSVEAVYENSAKKTGFVSDVLLCKSTKAASAALVKARKQVIVDSSIHVPGALGTEAFATGSDAPEYLMAWRAGAKLAIVAIDLDVKATSTSTTTANPPPLSASEQSTLQRAALHQNSLY